MEISIEENIKMEDLMELEHMNGVQMLPYMKETSKMDSDMEKENGLQDKLNIMDHILKV